MGVSLDSAAERSMHACGCPWWDGLVALGMGGTRVTVGAAQWLRTQNPTGWGLLRAFMFMVWWLPDVCVSLLQPCLLHPCRSCVSVRIDCFHGTDPPRALHNTRAFSLEYVH